MEFWAWDELGLSRDPEAGNVTDISCACSTGLNIVWLRQLVTGEQGGKACVGLG